MVSDRVGEQSPSKSRNSTDSSLTIGIVGLGLMGGSLAIRLVQSGIHVTAWNHHRHHYEDAMRQGIECVASPEALAQAKPSLIVLCNPLRAMPSVLDALAGSLDPDATTLMDVGSVKARVREQVQESGFDACYVGAHPMTGNEHSGFDAADPRLYDHALWAVTADSHTEWRRLITVLRFIVDAVGDRAIVLDDETHDRSAALISHMPHAVATALINELTDNPDRDIAAAMSAGSWRDMTRVALTDPLRTRAMIEEDADNVERLLRSMATRLTAFADDVHARDDAAIGRFFLAGQPFRDYKTGTPGSSVHERSYERRELDIDALDWRHQLLDSARRGEQIVTLESDRRFTVEVRSAW